MRASLVGIEPYGIGIVFLMSHVRRHIIAILFSLGVLSRLSNDVSSSPYACLCWPRPFYKVRNMPIPNSATVHHGNESTREDKVHSF